MTRTRPASGPPATGWSTQCPGRIPTHRVASTSRSWHHMLTILHVSRAPHHPPRSYDPSNRHDSLSTPLFALAQSRPLTTHTRATYIRNIHAITIPERDRHKSNTNATLHEAKKTHATRINDRYPESSSTPDGLDMRIHYIHPRTRD